MKIRRIKLNLSSLPLCSTIGMGLRQNSVFVNFVLNWKFTGINTETKVPKRQNRQYINREKL